MEYFVPIIKSIHYTSLFYLSLNSNGFQCVLAILINIWIMGRTLYPLLCVFLFSLSFSTCHIYFLKFLLLSVSPRLNLINHFNFFSFFTLSVTSLSYVHIHISLSLSLSLSQQKVYTQFIFCLPFLSLIMWIFILF